MIKVTEYDNGIRLRKDNDAIVDISHGTFPWIVEAQIDLVDATRFHTLGLFQTKRHAKRFAKAESKRLGKKK